MRVNVLAAATGVAATVALLAAALLAPIEVRHSAPFGFSQTLDARRGIAVRGGFVQTNYPGFNRLDLDLRAYDLAADYDLSIHIRPDEEGAADLRTLPLHVSGEQIRHDKSSFADPFLTVRFPPITDSAGERYYVRVEPGPRNRDDVVALWSIKTYSCTTGVTVLAAFLRGSAGDAAPGAVRSGLAALLLALALAFGWLVAATTAAVIRDSDPPRAGAGTVFRPSPGASSRGPRAVAFGLHRSARHRPG